MFDQIRANQRRSAILVVFMAALLFGIGYAFGALYLDDGLSGLVIAFIVWIILTLISYFQGDSIFLAVSGARKIGPDDHPVLWNVVEEMKIASGLPKMPDIYIIDDPAPNAFATGRDPERAAVTVTAGLLETLDRNELQGVIAHELGHVRNRDILYMMMIGVMLGTIVLLADIAMRMMFYGGLGRSRTSSSRDKGGQGQAIIMIVALVLIILAPIIAQMVYFAVSRKREYLADASGALFTRYPEGLASALEKISGAPAKMKQVSRMVAPSYIINPLAATGGSKANLFSTHPPTTERIRILRSMGNSAGLKSYENAFRKVTGKPVGVIPFKEQQTADVAVATPQQQQDAQAGLNRIRQTTDALWKLNAFGFINCACGTRLKIPPQLAGQQVQCPHCQAIHTAPKAGI